MTQTNSKTTFNQYNSVVKEKVGYFSDMLTDLQIEFEKADHMSYRLFEQLAHEKEPSNRIMSEILFDYMRRLDKRLDEIVKEVDSFYHSIGDLQDKLNATNEKEQAPNTGKSKWDCSNSTTLL